MREDWEIDMSKSGMVTIKKSALQSLNFTIHFSYKQHLKGYFICLNYLP